MLDFLSSAIDWPLWLSALSVPVLLLILALIALMPKRSTWKAVFCLILGYLVVANLTGLFVYQWVPAQYTLRQEWSWPPADDRSLGLIHGKRLAMAAGTEKTMPENAAAARRWVRDEQADFFQRWLLGPTPAGLALVALGALAFKLLRHPGSGAGKRQTAEATIRTK